MTYGTLLYCVLPFLKYLLKLWSCCGFYQIFGLLQTTGRETCSVGAGFWLLSSCIWDWWPFPWYVVKSLCLFIWSRRPKHIHMYACIDVPCTFPVPILFSTSSVKLKFQFNHPLFTIRYLIFNFAVHKKMIRTWEDWETLLPLSLLAKKIFWGWSWHPLINWLKGRVVQ